MISLRLYITENLRKNIKNTQYEAIFSACKEASCEVIDNIANEIILTHLVNDKNCFILSDASDFIFFITKSKEYISTNFILMPGDNQLSMFENFKEEMKNIRYLIGQIHIDLLKVIILHILTFKKLENNDNILNKFNLSSSSHFLYQLTHSSERITLQTQVVDFFYDEIQKHKDTFVAGSSAYSKILGDVLDEFLMNAIWDACPSRNNLDRSQAIKLNDHEKIELNCLCDGKNFILSVSDQYGTFKGESISKYIRYGLGYKEPELVKNSTPGAGIGIFMILQKIGILIFEVYKGKLTMASVITRGDQSIREVQKKPKTILFFEKE